MRLSRDHNLLLGCRVQASLPKEYHRPAGHTIPKGVNFHLESDSVAFAAVR